jgi:uncharacterized protein YebE (UPF0316 family)
VSLLIATAAPASPLLPLLIYVAETCVVTLGTIRIIFVSRGLKVLAASLGFFEVIVWLFAIGQIMQNLSNLGCYAAFAAGFTTGNFFGVLIEKKLAIGNLGVNIITSRDPSGLISRLLAAHYGITCMDGRGATGPVKIVHTLVKRKDLADVVAIIKEFDANAFYSVDDVQAVEAGVFPTNRGRARGLLPILPRLSRTTA